MRAVITTGGKQYTVAEGDEVLVERVDGKDLALDSLLVWDNGKTPKSGGKVTATILGEEKGNKVVVFKMKPKKRYRVKAGHRQRYSRIKIDKITA